MGSYGLGGANPRETYTTRAAMQRHRAVGWPAGGDGMCKPPCERPCEGHVKPCERPAAVPCAWWVLAALERPQVDSFDSARPCRAHFIL